MIIKQSQATMQVKDCIVWVTPRKGLTLQEGMERWKALGNEVLEVDEAGSRFKGLHFTPEDGPQYVDVYMCESCKEWGGIDPRVVTEHENECKKKSVGV